MKKIVLVVLNLVLSVGLIAQQFNCYEVDNRASERDHQIDISHMKLEVSFEVEKGLVHGEVEHTFTSLREKIDTLFFDAPGISIHEAEYNGKKVKFTTNPSGVVVHFEKPITWGKEHAIEFEYTAKPRKGLYFIGWNTAEALDKKTMTRRQIWTQGQGIDNRHWIPMYDDMNDKFITETIVKFDKAYKVLSNGDLVSKKEKGNNILWHYKLNNPHAGYLLMLAIDKYAVKETKTKGGTPVQFWYYPEHPEKLEPTSLHTEKIIEFLERETGVSYPWGTYSQVMVQDFMYGAMENTSATIFGDFFFVDKRAFHDRNYIGVNAHELTHQWFGDLITARSSAHAWLQESFATYYAKLFFQELQGEDALKWSQRGEVNTALRASKGNNKPVMHTGAGSSRIYSKGSTVLQMMRYVMGDAHFKKAINHFLKTYSFKNCDTDDFKQAIMDATGMNLDWFFEQWIKKGGEPEYKISYIATKYNTQISIEQTHEINTTTGLFKMPINFAVYYKDGSVDRKNIWIKDAHQFVTIENPKGKDISFVLFDENSEITKKVHFEKSFDALSNQLLNANKMIDRYDAVLAMKTLPLQMKKEVLLKAYESEKYWAIRAEIASQLAKMEDIQVLTKLYHDKHAGVRKALIDEITVNKENSNLLLSMLKDSSYNAVLVAFNRIMNSHLDREIRLNALNSLVLETGHYNNIKIAWLEHAMDFNPDRKMQFNQSLKYFASNNYEFKTRINAMNALKRLNVFDKDLLVSLLDAGTSTNRRLASPAREVYKFFAEQPEYLKIIKNHFETTKYDSTRYDLIKGAGMWK